MDGHDYNVASNQKANTALGLGIAGAALGLGVLNGNGCNNGLLGGILGGNNRHDCYVTEKEFNWSNAYQQKNAEVDMLKSDQRTDGKLLELYRELDRRFTTTGEVIASISSNQAVINQKLTDNIAFTDSKIDSTNAATRCWVEANYVPGKLVMPLDSICPRAQPACPEVVNVDIVQQVATQLAKAFARQSAK